MGIELMRNNENFIGFQNFLKYVEEMTDIKNIIVVEIGSYAGESTIMFAKKVKNVISVDPFMNFHDVYNSTCYHIDLSTTLYDEFIKNISPYPNITHIRKTSDDAIHELSDNTFDLVYIDGLHTYDQVKKDIENYRKIVKPGGLLCGHDYLKDGKIEHIEGVYRAVNEMLGEPDVVFEDLTWVKKL